MKIFRDRTEAGELLAQQLERYANRNDVIVLALPRGGVPVAYEISKRLHLPLDVFLVRKLGVPGHEELALGALAQGNIKVFNEEVLNSLYISKEVIDEIIAREQKELDRRSQRYRNNRPPLDIKNKIVILVDDGLATGATMRAAVMAIKKLAPARVIVAAPVAPPNVYQSFKNLADEIICLEVSPAFYSISQWYEYFPQTTDEEVCELLTNHQPKAP